MVLDLVALLLFSPLAWGREGESHLADNYKNLDPKGSSALWLAQELTEDKAAPATTSAPAAPSDSSPAPNNATTAKKPVPPLPPDESASNEAIEANAIDFSPIKLSLGSGVIYAADGIKKYVENGEFYTIGFSYPYQTSEELTSYLGVIYNYGKYTKKLSVLDDQGMAPTFHLVEFDLAAIMGFEYPWRENVFLIYEFGPALQQRAMSIKAGLDGIDNDSYAAFGLGIVAKAACEFHFELMERTLLSRLFVNLATGSKMLSSKLKYSHTHMDINATQFGLGVEIGYAF